MDSARGIGLPLHLIANKMSEHLLSTYCTSGIRLSLLGVLPHFSHNPIWERLLPPLKMRGGNKAEEILLRRG